MTSGESNPRPLAPGEWLNFRSLKQHPMVYIPSSIPLAELWIDKSYPWFIHILNTINIRLLISTLQSCGQQEEYINIVIKDKFFIGHGILRPGRVTKSLLSENCVYSVSEAPLVYTSMMLLKNYYLFLFTGPTVKY